MPHEASRKAKPKTKKKTGISVSGRLSVYSDPSTLNSRAEKALHFVGVGWLKDADLVELRKSVTTKKGRHNREAPKLSVCQNCGRVWKASGNGKPGILRICPECKIREKILSKIRFA
jgi:hypothetical protein